MRTSFFFQYSLSKISPVIFFLVTKLIHRIIMCRSKRWNFSDMRSSFHVTCDNVNWKDASVTTQDRCKLIVFHFIPLPVRTNCGLTNSSVCWRVYECASRFVCVCVWSGALTTVIYFLYEINDGLARINLKLKRHWCTRFARSSSARFGLVWLCWVAHSVRFASNECWM